MLGSGDALLSIIQVYCFFFHTNVIINVYHNVKLRHTTYNIHKRQVELLQLDKDTMGFKGQYQHMQRPTHRMKSIQQITKKSSAKAMVNSGPDPLHDVRIVAGSGWPG